VTWQPALGGNAANGGIVWTGHTGASAAASAGHRTGAWLGIQGMTLTSEIAGAMDLSSSQEGVLVVEVTPDSPAERRACLAALGPWISMGSSSKWERRDRAIDGQSVSQMQS